MNRYIHILFTVVFCLSAQIADAQVDKKDVRRGNRDFKKESYREAEIEYRKGVVKDSLSVAANYNLATDLYRQSNFQEAAKVLERIKEVAPASKNGADYFYNVGDVAIANQDWQTAVTAFSQSLLINPGDLDAKDNYIYAKKKLEQQQQQQQQNQDNQDQNDQNQDQQNDQQNDQNQDQQDDKQNDDKKNDQQNNQNDDRKDERQQNQGQQPKITPQAAQQMLQAIQAKEKETQAKVKKEKAEALKSKQKEKNW